MALLDKRLVFVLGKGGVGKSVVTAALGLVGAGRGKQTLLVEMNGQESQADLFGAAPVGYRGGPLFGEVTGMSIRSGDALEDYLVRALRFRSLYELVFKNRYIEPLMDGILGLSDLISVGKLMDLEWQRQDGSFGPESEGPWLHDLIVVDGPATGHGLSMLQAPEAMMDVARAGPLFHNAQMIASLLSDPERTAVLLVTLPEEMPVSETLDTARALREVGQVSVAGVVVNAMPTTLPAPEGEAWKRLSRNAEEAGGHLAAALRFAERGQRQRAEADEQVRQLRNSLDLPVLELPVLTGQTMNHAALAHLAGILEGWV